MTQPKLPSRLAAMLALAVSAAITAHAVAQAPPVPHADADYQASGYVVPAGMVPPSQYQGGVMPIGMASPYPGGVQQVGFLGNSGGCDGCDGGCSSCDSMGYGGGYGNSCNGGCGGACGGHCNESGCGLFDSAFCGGGCGCGSGKCCLSCLSKLCLFCQGDGCSACKSMCFGRLKGALGLCRPYGELCGLRWYDLSVEAVFLGHNNGSPNIGVTTLGRRDLDPNAPLVLSLGDASAGGDLATGARISGALICGPGGNVEATYMGGNQWSDRAEATDYPGAGLYSFISFFGSDPPDGFDDTDRSLVQRVDTRSEFHTVELNYRRRTMGPYCRFQGSWLVGLRYMQFYNKLQYSTLGTLNNAVVPRRRFFSSTEKIKNDLFGPQAGFDLWWNIYGGVRLGIEWKGAWVQNDVDRDTIYTANSLGAGATPATIQRVDRDRFGTIMGEFQMKFVWQFNHSWKFRSAYYAVCADDIAFAGADRSTIRQFATLQPVGEPRFNFDSLTVQGVSFGTEYTW